MDQFEKIVVQYHLETKDAFNFEKFNEFAITYHSTALEGSTLSSIETEVLLEKGLTPKGKPIAHSLMALDHQKALQYILKLADTKTALTIEHIQKISSLILKNSLGPVRCAAGTFDPSKGEFRKNTVFAGELTFPKPEKVEKLTAVFLEELNQKNNQVKTVNQIYCLSFSAHFQLYNIHPFVDGNSRLSRLLMNYVQRYHGQPLSIVDIKNRADYKESLSRSRVEKSIEPFFKFMKETTAIFFQSEITRLKRPLKLNKGIDGISFLF